MADFEACMRVLQVGSRLLWHQMHAVALHMTPCYHISVQR